MGFKINWYVEKQVISLKLFDAVSADEVLEINRQTVQFAQDGLAPVHIIIDTLGVSEFPTNLRWVLQIMQSNPIAPSGWHILIHNNPIIHFLSSTVLSLLRVPVYACGSVAEAKQFLHDKQPLAFVS